MRRFTLIQGGYGPQTTDGAAWRIDLKGVQGVDAEMVAAWRALIARNAVLDPRTDPDYLLTAARHLAGGEQIAFALAWELGAVPELRGVVPLAIAEPLFRASRARPWWPPGLAARSLVDPGRGTAIHAAVAAHLRALPRPVAYDPTPRANTLSGRRRVIPAESVVGIRPEGYVPPSATVEMIRDPERVRDAVEAFLALDARTARQPIIAEPQEAAMVRVVTRLFARRQELAVALASRAGNLVAGTIHLGQGSGAIAWRHAGLDASLA
ncbi:GNAT family N-acetyltransferase [Methylobacterium radiodurans]|uniref:Uncharacterized protein n=1 Tax=Methylobacterium radiodurans TaxID=2202828 RepID=A0A2U8VSI7_9HYPH|nr:GNAT family N-acetyltransferase [Methylobacterium radiodurans]AWN36252.1 hypothetical protein DK427_11405 [Methylobacterium radiodurans]